MPLSADGVTETDWQYRKLVRSESQPGDVSEKCYWEEVRTPAPAGQNWWRGAARCRLVY